MSEGVRIRELNVHRTGPTENLLIRPDAEQKKKNGENIWDGWACLWTGNRTARS